VKSGHVADREWQKAQPLRVRHAGAQCECCERIAHHFIRIDVVLFRNLNRDQRCDVAGSRDQQPFAIVRRAGRLRAAENEALADREFDRFALFDLDALFL